MTVGQNIRRLRERAGMSQSELARRIGKTRSMISQYECDMYAPRMGTVEKLAAALNCKKSEIIDDSPANALSPDETELLDLYRSLDRNGREMALCAVRGMASHEDSSHVAEGKLA